MGCGASAGGGGGGGGRGSRYSAPIEVRQSISSEASSEAQVRDCPWHRKNCTDVDLRLVNTIQEAYPFDDSKRKSIDKTERVWNPAGDGRHHEWGEVSIAKLGPKKLNCTTCGVLILERDDGPGRDDPQERPFWFCIRCRTQGKMCNLCVECYDNGVLASGAHPRQFTATRLSSKSRRDTFANEPLYEQTIGVNNPAAALGLAPAGGGARLSVQPPNPMVRTPSKGSNRPHPTIPSGAWKGKVSEGASARPVIYKLLYQQDGGVSGTGPEDSTVSGSYHPQATIFKVKWIENHSWGTITVTGEVLPNETPVRARGKFTASDGGGGKLELVAV